VRLVLPDDVVRALGPDHGCTRSRDSVYVRRSCSDGYLELVKSESVN